MKNKGLRVIDIIIIIVVLAAITVLIFPIISKHIQKSYMQADMEMAQKIATVMKDVLSKEKINENAVEHATPQLGSNMDGSDFKKAVYAALEMEVIEGKTKKDVDGEPLT
ncbi:MAG: hypothetical protein J6C01_07450, partial [Lachnospiraceae bacterium]|nr:hypothetical protein [Lachnospiraceae bacterium]